MQSPSTPHCLSIHFSFFFQQLMINYSSIIMNPSQARMSAYVTRLCAFRDRLEVQRGEAKCRVVDEIDRRFDLMQAGLISLINRAQDQINKPARPSSNKRLPLIKREEIKEEENEESIGIIQKRTKRLPSHVKSPGPSNVVSNTQNREPPQRKATKRVRFKENQSTAQKYENAYIKVKHINCTQENCTAKLKSQEQYYEHLKQKHGLMKYSCLAKNCGQRFNNSRPMGKHLKDTHRNITKWQCDKCPIQCNSPRLLSQHMYFYHQEGKFLCAQSECRFKATTRTKVKNHAQYKHSSPQLKRFICAQDGCGKSFRKESELQNHERIHLAIKPFSCGWDGCEYFSKKCCNVLRHIRTRHFKLPETLKAQKQKDTRDPNVYVRVNQDLASRRL